MGVYDRDPEGGPGESDSLARPHTMCGLDRTRSRMRSIAPRLWRVCSAGAGRGHGARTARPTENTRCRWWPNLKL